MIDWSYAKDKMPQGFKRVVMVITYPQDRYFREGYWDSDRNVWYTTTQTGSFQVRHPNAVVTHWSYINLPDDTCKCAIPGFDVGRPGICPTCGQTRRG
jgi:hypothetical protein